MSRDNLYKGSVHAAAMALACTMMLYNLGEACGARCRRRHILNTIVYFGATIWEATNVYDHWSH